MDEQDQSRAWRLTPLTLVLALIVVALLGLNFALGKKTERENAPQQAEIEKMVKQTNDFQAKIQKMRDDTRALLDPLVMLLELDRRLEAEGLPPLSAKDFTGRLAEANRHLVESGSTQYIDTCAQKGEVEKHLLYQGLHGEGFFSNASRPDPGPPGVVEGLADSMYNDPAAALTSL
ncbi:MAG TPA: hypothetical protein VKK31_19575 [Thermoanaerobaculia bacterium]|nr:hypothetical protein [Thermoanaerobaculia bacterium]